MEKTFETLVNATAEMLNNSNCPTAMLKDFIGSVRCTYTKMRMFDADGTFKPNNGSSENPLYAMSREGLECLQVITQKCLDLRLTADIDLDWDAFYDHCRNIWFGFLAKYINTDFSEIGESMWGVAELYAEKKFGRL